MEPNTDKRILLDAAQVQQAIVRIADAICSEFFSGGVFTPVAFLGIQSCGIPLSRRIARIIREKCGYDAPVGTLDISMYRDDIGTRKALPVIRETNIPFDINGCVLILADDVLQTGRTIRAALDAVTDYGRPAMIRLAALVDRGMREFPIRADYIGASLEAAGDERINTEWAEYNQTDAVYAVRRPKAQ